MTILALTSAPVNSAPLTMPGWSDADRQGSTPDPDATPVAPYTAEDADWWAEQTRDDGPPVEGESDDDNGPYHTHLDWLAGERDVEDRLCRGLLC